MSQRSIAGGFGERALEKIVSKDMFVPACFEEVVISRRVEYYSGSVGRGPKHVGSVDVVERWDEGDVREIRDVGVAPNLYVELYAKTINERVVVSMSASELVQFGEFSSLTGHFRFTVSEVDVKISSDSVEIEGFGSYKRADDVNDTMTYSSWLSQRRQIFDRGYECGEVAEERLRKAWAESEGLRSDEWYVEEVDDPEYSSRATLYVENSDVDERLKFSFSMDDWDDNESIRNLIESVGGVTSNLEQETVWVTLDEISGTEPVAESDGWYLYCSEDKPNPVSRFLGKYL